MDGIKNIFERFFQVGKIAKEAFDDIFPPKTQEDLTKAAKKFDDITKSMEISEEKAEKLKKSFKGLFAALDIGSYLLTSGINFLKDVFLGTSDSILDTNASLGDMIVSLRDWLKEGDRVGKALKKVSDFINKLKNNFKGLKDGTKSVSDVFDGLFDNMSID
jgi:archaellum component FlaC